MAKEDGYACRHYDPAFHPDKSVFGQQYDFITCSETAEHFHQPKEEFRQLAALLRPGAWLALMTSRLTPETRFENWSYRLDHTHVCFYTDACFEWIADNYGFERPHFHSSNVALLQKS